MESDELSMETTVPTDLSLSPDDTSAEFRNADDRKKRISKQLLERKQLLHDMQVLKIELSQKSMIIDSMKAEHMQKAEDLEDRLSDALHKKQLLQAKLESQLQIQQEESRKRHEQIQRELDTILKRQHELESTNEQLQDKAVDIRHSLKDWDITENQFRELKLKSEEELSLRDFVAIKLFETVRPWKLENEELKCRCRTQSDDLHKCRTELEQTKDALEDEKRTHSDLYVKHQKVTLAYADTKAQVQHGDYKIENYDRVKRERDEFDSELTDLKKHHGYLEATHQVVSKERDDLGSEMAALKQSLTLLRQDKDYFSKQVSELHNKLLYAEDKNVNVGEQLERLKQSREELYDKYVASRDQYKSEYEARLRQELEGIRVRTDTEIDRLKTSSREMYERENRNLREARDMALAEKDRAVASRNDADTKYEQLLQELHQMQMKSDNQVSELNNEVKLRAFESQRTQMVYEETCKNLKECQLENEKLSKKLEVLTKEYYSLQTSMEKRVSELETGLGEKTTKLETYEKLEMELDDVVMQAADVEDETDAERVLFSYGYGANVPTTAKRRLKQSVELARRVLQLERANTSMRKEIEREHTKCSQLTEELASANQLLSQSQQPYHYLVESVQLRDTQIKKQKEHIAVLEQDVGRLDKERSQVTKSKNRMAADLERLLNQKEEMSVMKQVVMNLGQRHHGSQPATARSARTPKSPKPLRSPKGKAGKKTAAVYQPKSTFEVEPEENVHKPKPTHFTVDEGADWYSKLQQKKQMASKYSRVYKTAA